MSQPTPVYEWYRYEEISSIPVNQTHGQTLTNPPFFPGPAGRLQPYMQGGPILRGFLKRTDPANGISNDIGARGRCYFMFNPTSLSQAWNWDPSMYTSQQTSGDDAATAPVGQAAFQFALFFERSIEVAHNPDHAGVLVDIDVLSYIIRGVPTGLAGTTPGPGVHSKGVDSSNPSAIAEPSGAFIGRGELIDVIFSKYMTVRGNVSSLQIEYVKFSHRMVPTMCSVNIGMMVTAQSIGTQSSIDTAQTSGGTTTNGGGAGTGDPSNRYGTHAPGGGP
jgi:hypothetical protein